MSYARALSRWFTIAFAISSLGAISSLCACSGPAKHSDYASSGVVSQEMVSGAEGTAARVNERELIKTGRQKVTVKDVGSASDQITKITAASGGYVEQSMSDSESGANFELRVPAQQLDTVMNHVAALGKEEARNVQVTDTTDAVIDLKARIANAIALRDRVRDLAKAAKELKDVMELERELARVQTEIDELQGKLKTLQSQVAYSKLNVSLKRERILGPLGYLGYGVAWVVQKLFVIE